MRKLLLSMAFAMFVTGAARAELITTLPTWDGSFAAFPFGEPNTATYGQTITVGTDNILTNFQFRLQTDFGTSRFAGYVMQWDAGLNRATGPVLYSSGEQTNTGGFNAISFDTNVTLTTGQQYVLFISASNFFDGIDDQAVMGLNAELFPSAYAGGTFVYSNNGSDFGSLTNNSWDNFDWDSAFSAQLVSVVPVPSGVILAGLGCLGLATVTWLRQRKLKLA